VGTFLRVEGAESQDIALAGNDLRTAKHPAEAESGASASAIETAPAGFTSGR
jgi:hypothetical protein